MGIQYPANKFPKDIGTWTHIEMQKICFKDEFTFPLEKQGWVWTRPRLTGAQAKVELWGPNGPQLQDAIQDGPKDSDVSAGVCWLISSIGTTAHQQKQLIMDSVRESTSRPGFFEVDLWFTGERKTIFVDERFPFQLRPIYREIRYFWAAIIEKAFAKYHQSYKFLSSGSCYEGLCCLTGQPATQFPIINNKTPMSLETLRDYVNRKYVVTAARDGHDFGIYKIEGRDVFLFEPNNSKDYSTASEFHKPPGSTQVPGQSGLLRIPFSGFQEEFVSLTVCWTGKYDRVKHFKGTPVIEYTLTTNKPTQKEDVVVCGFQSSNRSKKYSYKGKEVEYPQVDLDFYEQGRHRDSWVSCHNVVSTIERKAFVMQPNTSYSLAVKSTVAGAGFHEFSFHVKKGSGIKLTVTESSAQDNGQQRKS